MPMLDDLPDEVPDRMRRGPRHSHPLLSPTQELMNSLHHNRAFRRAS